jgi:hypothetical protein
MSSEHSPAKQAGIGHNGGPPLTGDDLKVLSLKQWCAINGFSVATGNRIIKRGDGPKLIQLSLRKFGICVGDNRRWQESRVRA